MKHNILTKSQVPTQKNESGTRPAKHKHTEDNSTNKTKMYVPQIWAYLQRVQTTY